MNLLRRLLALCLMASAGAWAQSPVNPLLDSGQLTIDSSILPESGLVPAVERVLGPLQRLLGPQFGLLRDVRSAVVAREAGVGRGTAAAGTSEGAT